MWTGVIILGLCLAILIYFITKLKDAYENFWKFIKKSVISSYTLLSQAAYDRLRWTHGIKISKKRYSNHQKHKAII
ncbi:unnamed protein product [Blepharisma stoltei]|uniref:Uncharacterized protein n=1 Tax=Blepharisma stoltei TaxID=1481888 RepID=A0AAU9JYZ9_9CILI|nr:unnamed protein product [Blepharisma stoltei]